MPKINEKTVTQYERVGCGTFDTTDGIPTAFDLQVHWVEEVEGVARFRSVSRNIPVVYDANKPEHVAFFAAFLAIIAEALSSPVQPSFRPALNVVTS